MIGRRFNKLLVTELSHIDRHKYWRCLCDCGNYRIVRSSALNSNYVKNCGKCKDMKYYKVTNDIVLAINKHGDHFIINLVDLPKIINYNWTYNKMYGYFMANDKGKTLLLHKLIVDTDSETVDHLDTNKRNNRGRNLRPATHQQNNFNRPLLNRKNRTSKYKGVSKVHDTRWRVQICKDNERLNVGYYETEDEAGLAYNEKAKELFGEFAYLNHID